jgi:hypothetical protein
VTETPKDQQKQSRTRRLSVALRDNLKRRKAQARWRTAAQGGEQDRGEQDRGEQDRGEQDRGEQDRAGPSKETHDSAGFAGDKRSR